MSMRLRRAYPSRGLSFGARNDLEANPLLDLVLTSLAHPAPCYSKRGQRPELRASGRREREGIWGRAQCGVKCHPKPAIRGQALTQTRPLYDPTTFRLAVRACESELCLSQIAPNGSHSQGRRGFVGRIDRTPGESTVHMFDLTLKIL